MTRPAIYFTTEPRFCNCATLVKIEGAEHLHTCPARCRAMHTEHVGPNRIMGAGKRDVMWTARCRLGNEHAGSHEGNGMGGTPVVWNGPES